MTACPDESVLLDHAAGRSDEASRAKLESHLAECTNCSSMVSDARDRARIAGQSPTLSTAPQFGPEDGASFGDEVTQKKARPRLEGTLIDRYKLLETLGAGGMGIVYLAHDPELDRRVALKLVRPERASGPGGEQMRLRILREAQAMARLSHPAVIQVYDAGTVGDRVFVAMELIEGGGTLADWLRKEPRSWREVLDIFLQAGRGLAAAHAAGIVHRDFKPHNVLVGKNGEVRVTDFGLARLAGRAEFPTPAEGETPKSPDLTLLGGVLGTPGYMAPEQMEGKVADARSDLFSFCVALFEALNGARPFSGTTLRELRQAVREKHFAPVNPAVPEWVQKATRRGLREWPERRPASMNALLELLQRDPARRRRAIGLGLALFAIAAITAGALWWRSGAPARLCSGVGQKLAGAWDGPVQATIERTFLSSKKPYAKAAWSASKRELDLYSHDWIVMSRQVCEAQVKRGGSPELLAARADCLEDGANELRALSGSFTTAGDELIKEAARSSAALSPLAACADTRALLAPAPPAPEQRPQVEALRARLAALRGMGRGLAPEKLIPIERALLADVRKIGYRPLESEALLMLGLSTANTGDEQQAVKFFEEAAASGTAAKVDRSAAIAWLEITNSRVQLSEHDEAVRAAVQAKAAVDRAGDDALRGKLELALAFVDHASDVPAATLHAREAVRLFPAGSADRAAASDELANLLHQSGQLEESLTVGEESLRMLRAELGEQHPEVAEAEMTVADTLHDLGRTAESKARLLDALSIAEASAPESMLTASILTLVAEQEAESAPAKALERLAQAEALHRAVGSANGELAHVYFVRGRVEEAMGNSAEAEAALRQGVALDDQIGNEVNAAQARIELAAVLTADHKFVESRALLNQAVGALIYSLGPDNPAVGDGACELALLEILQKHLQPARAQLAKARAAYENSYPPESPALRRVELLTARADLLAGQRDAAIASLEGALAPLPLPEGWSDFDAAEARFLLAQNLWTHPASRAHAVALAHLAHDDYAARGVHYREEAAATAQWLAAHNP